MFRLVIANKNYSSWSLRPWVLMKALGIPFSEEQTFFAPGDNFAAFRGFSPSGRVPCLLDGDRPVWDSLGITLYLADRYPGVWPQADAARAWAQCAVSEMHSGFSALRTICSMTVGQRIRLHAVPAELERDLDRIRELFEQGLESFGGPWLAGSAFTAADAFYAPVAFRLRGYGLDLGPAVAAWLDLLLDHPAMREWEEGALAETRRDEPHEQEILHHGSVIADYRKEAE